MTQAIEDAVTAMLARVGKTLVVGAPLGIGKPNEVINAIYRRAKRDPSIRLELATALSLAPPRGKEELEERFLAPIRARVWGDYPRLDYVDDQEADAVPDNIRIVEFYVRSGSILGHPTAQRHVMSANYTHAARDIVARGLNVMVQALAVREGPSGPVYSYGPNPDVTPELVSRLAASGKRAFAIGLVNRKLPWFGHRAIVPEGTFDVIVDDPALDHEPFSVPHEPVSIADYAIGLHASSLVRDGGTLQVGIGALGDAACHALRLRHADNDAYRALLDALGPSALAASIGGTGRFDEGLYVASELLSNPLFSLYEAGIVKRKVYDPETGGDASEAGTTMQGAFFVGPRDFYERLRALPDSERALVDMASVAEVNRIFQAYDVERNQRRHARFVNVCMKATLFGAAVSDQLADGQVVSGVGGQHDFVTMAHQLPDGRSVLLFRASRGGGRAFQSNVVLEYPHATIARHLRDVFVSEYGIADLRGKTDEECAKAMIAIADSRSQDELLKAARRAKKLDPRWEIPAQFRDNTPERLSRALGDATRSRETKSATGETTTTAAVLPRLPFGCDLTEAELDLGAKLKKIGAARSSPRGAVELAGALAMPAPADDPKVAAALEHLGLHAPTSAKEVVLARLVRAAFVLRSTG